MLRVTLENTDPSRPLTPSPIGDNVRPAIQTTATHSFKVASNLKLSSNGLTFSYLKQNMTMMRVTDALRNYILDLFELTGSLHFHEGDF